MKSAEFGKNLLKMTEFCWIQKDMLNSWKICWIQEKSSKCERNLLKQSPTKHIELKLRNALVFVSAQAETGTTYLKLFWSRTISRPKKKSKDLTEIPSSSLKKSYRAYSSLRDGTKPTLQMVPAATKAEIFFFFTKCILPIIKNKSALKKLTLKSMCCLAVGRSSLSWHTLSLARSLQKIAKCCISMAWGTFHFALTKKQNLSLMLRTFTTFCLLFHLIYFSKNIIG